MKKSIFLLVMITFLFAGCGLASSQSNTLSTQKATVDLSEDSDKESGDTVNQEENMELAGFYDSVSHEDYENILTNPGNNLYYFYQTTCSHCNDLKPTMKDFDDELKEQEDVNLYFVDMQAAPNLDAWAKDSSYDETDLDSMKTYEDVKVKGTPTMIYVKDGKVVSYGMGSDEIEAIMLQVENEFNIKSLR